MKNIREIAEDHWKYTEGIIRKALESVNDQYTKGSLELMHYLYVEAFCHGFKHREDELKE